MKTLREILKASIAEVQRERETGMITEMAISRSNYKQRIDAVLPQILINWCLVRYRTLTNTEQYKKHWQGEFRGQMYNASRLAIKGNDSSESRKKILDEICKENDYNNPKFVNLTVCNKFIDEGFDINSEEYMQVILDCINELQTIFGLILDRDINNINNYAKTI